MIFLVLFAIIALIPICIITRHNSDNISPKEDDDYSDVLWCKIIEAKPPNEALVKDIMGIFESYISEGTASVPTELHSYLQEYANAQQEHLFEEAFEQNEMCNELMVLCIKATNMALSFNRSIPKGKKRKINEHLKELRQKVTDSKFVSTEKLANADDIAKVVNSTIELLDYLAYTEGRKRSSLVSEKNCEYLKSKKNEFLLKLQHIRDFSWQIEQEYKNLTIFDENCKKIGILLKIHRWNI